MKYAKVHFDDSPLQRGFLYQPQADALWRCVYTAS